MPKHIWWLSHQRDGLGLHPFCLLCEWTGAFRFPPPAATEALSGEGGGDTAQEERAWLSSSCGFPCRHRAQLSQQQALAVLRVSLVSESGAYSPAAVCRLLNVVAPLVTEQRF